MGRNKLQIEIPQKTQITRVYRVTKNTFNIILTTGIFLTPET
jgi:hypothetical protein